MHLPAAKVLSVAIAATATVMTTASLRLLGGGATASAARRALPSGFIAAHGNKDRDRYTE